jgi:hypothetical protein
MRQLIPLRRLVHLSITSRQPLREMSWSPDGVRKQSSSGNSQRNICSSQDYSTCPCCFRRQFLDRTGPSLCCATTVSRLPIPTQETPTSRKRTAFLGATNPQKPVRSSLRDCGQKSPNEFVKTVLPCPSTRPLNVLSPGRTPVHSLDTAHTP